MCFVLVEYLPLNVSPHLEPEGAIYLLTSSTLHPGEGRKLFCFEKIIDGFCKLLLTVPYGVPSVTALHIVSHCCTTVCYYCEWQRLFYGTVCCMAPHVQCTALPATTVLYASERSWVCISAILNGEKKKRKKITSLWFYVRWFQAGQALPKESASSNKDEFNFSPLWFVVWRRTFVTWLRILSKQCVTACRLRSQKRSGWF